ncbi:MAG TPA: hypothetical protein VGF18_05920 [Candidatus Tumulicola sp.]
MTTDDASLVRDLLRRLGNAGALRNNALVAEMLPSLDVDDRRLCEEILSRVRRGVNALGERGGAGGILEREIVRRCDLERTDHKVVIADLGISRRVFYYHRRRALRHLGEHLRGSSSFAVRKTTNLLDEFEIYVGRAASLAALGNVKDATLAASRAEAVAATPEQRVHASALLAEYAAESGRVDGLADRLGRLENALTNIERQSNSNNATAWLEGAHVASLLRWRIGADDPLPEMRTIATIARSARNVDAAALDARARFLLTYADFANVGGAPVEARSVLDEAGAIVRHLDEPSLGLRVRLPIAEAVVSLALLQPLSYAADRAAAALDISVRHGLIPYALDASAVLAMSEMARGRAQAALDVVRSARSAALSLGPHEAGQFFFLSAARVCAAAGALNDARDMLDLAERQIVSSGLLAATQQFTRAVLTLADGRPSSAAKYATETMHLSGRYKHKRMEGRALGIRAQALVALGREREARNASIDAISVLERYGTRHTLASAYELSASLARETRYKRHAKELRSALSS